MKKKAFNFKLMSTSNKVVELNKIKSKYVILYFYPKDDTSGCTIETKDFNKLLNKFRKHDCTILGVSKDSLESHKKWSKKNNFFKFFRRKASNKFVWTIF